MTFNFNYNMLCCVFFFFVLYLLQTSTSSLNYFRQQSALYTRSIYTHSLSLSLSLQSLVLSRRRNYKKISNHEQNGDKRPHVPQLPFVTFLSVTRIFFSSSICLLVRSLFLSFSLSLTPPTPFRSIYLLRISVSSFFFSFRRASRVTTNYTVTLFHYYRYITLRHYIFINSSCIHSPLYSNTTLISVNLCLNRREIARCNSSGSKGKKKKNTGEKNVV